MKYIDKKMFETIFCSLKSPGSLHEMADEFGHCSLSLAADNRKKYPMVLLRAFKLLYRLRPHILHAHLFDSCAMGAVLSMAFPGTRFVITRHHSDQHHIYKKPIHIKIDKFVARRADFVITVSKFGKRVMVEDEGIPEGKIGVIPVGINTERFIPIDSHERDCLKRDLGLEGFFVIGTVGNLILRKAHRYLLEAVPKVIEHYKKVKFIVVGDGPLRHEIKGFVLSRGISKNVVLFGRVDDVERYYGAMDMLIHTSFSEVCCQVILEALAMNIPVIATDTGNASEVIRNGINGFVIPKGDSDAIAKIILRILLDPDLYRKLCFYESRQIVLKNFDLGKVVRDYEKVYLKLVEGK